MTEHTHFLPPPAARLQHVHVFCSDLDKMIAFWTGAFGARLVRKRFFGPYDGAVLTLGTSVELYLKSLPCGAAPVKQAQAGVDHVGLCVEDLEASLAYALTCPGVSLETAPFMSENFYCAFIRGEEDILVELVQDLA